MCVGGEAETTACKFSCICIGVKYRKVAHLMNADAEGQAIGLKDVYPLELKVQLKKAMLYMHGKMEYVRNYSNILISRYSFFFPEASDTEDEKLIECLESINIRSLKELLWQ